MLTDLIQPLGNHDEIGDHILFVHGYMASIQDKLDIPFLCSVLRNFSNLFDWIGLDIIYPRLLNKWFDFFDFST